MSATQLFLLELNEINFEFVNAYAERGLLPNLGRLINRHGIAETTSEYEYSELEPWIQWVTAHTGLTLAEHGVRRLGDITKHDHHQIWEHLQNFGLSVGAISPMNAKNRLNNPAYFLPDPWTPTPISGRAGLRSLYAAVAQAVNDNAQSRVTLQSAAQLMAGLMRFAQISNYAKYSRLALGSLSRPWFKALFLDLLLTDVFITESKRKFTNFSSLFLNAGAHIQHHYMFNSAVYTGEGRNPSWYVSENADPLLDVYTLYDCLVGQIIDSFPHARLMIATGLHQDPHTELTWYWRLKDHDAFLRKTGVPFVRVEPLMSRDFLVVCASTEQALEAERCLAAMVGDDGAPLFEVNNRGNDLFVMLTYPHDIESRFGFRTVDAHQAGLKDDVAFVAVKNGQHNGIGYFIDTGLAAGNHQRFKLSCLPARICEALGVDWPRPCPKAVGASAPDV